jgi:hypothetical protein
MKDKERQSYGDGYKDSETVNNNVHTVTRYPDRETDKQTHGQNTEENVKSVNIRDKVKQSNPVTGPVVAQRRVQG